jgi:hypothetical protein
MRRLPAQPVTEPKVGETVGCDASSTAVSPSSMSGAAAAGSAATSVAGRSTACWAAGATVAGACAGPGDTFGWHAVAKQVRLKAALSGNADERSESWGMAVLYVTP